MGIIFANIFTGRFALLSLVFALISWATHWPARNQYNGRSDSFLLTCGGIESVAWHPKTVDRSAQTRQVQINSPDLHLHAPPNSTCSRWYDHEWLNADFQPVLLSSMWPWFWYKLLCLKIFSELHLTLSKRFQRHVHHVYFLFYYWARALIEAHKRSVDLWTTRRINMMYNHTMM